MSEGKTLLALLIAAYALDGDLGQQLAGRVIPGGSGIVTAGRSARPAR